LSIALIASTNAERYSMKIDQEVFIQQIMTAISKGNQPIIVGGIEVHSGGEFSFEGYLESLPQPRLRTLVERAKMVAQTRCASGRRAAEWLGVSNQTMKRFEFSDEEDSPNELLEDKGRIT